MKKFKIAIFGLSELLGRGLYEILKENNYKIKGYSRKKPEWFKDEYIKWEAGEVPEKIDEKIIVYLASISGNWQVLQNTKKAFEVIVKTPFEIMNKLKENSYFLYISSAGVYPEKSSPKKEEDVNPKNLYGAMKFSGEILLSNLAKSKKIKFCALRFSRIYGKGMQRNPIADFLKGFKKGKVILYDDFSAEYDYIYVKDAARAILMAIKNKWEGIYNTGSGKGIKVSEIKKVFEKLKGKKFKIEFKMKRKGKDILNVERIKKLGFKNIYNIKKGIREILQYL